MTEFRWFPARGSVRSWFLHPTRLLVFAFLAACAVGTLLLLMPAATVADGRATLQVALFTAVSSVSVTGLVLVDTGTHWSGFGQVVILVLIQLGGFGMTSFASLFAVLVLRRLGLRSRMVAQLERREFDVGGVRDLISRVAVFYVVVQAAGFLVIYGLLVGVRGNGAGEALWPAFFHTGSAFNNAGFSVFDDSLTGWAGDPALLVVIMALVVVGGIGFPVVLDIWRRPHRPRQWTLHSKITVGATAVLLLVGAVLVTAFEWQNADSLGELGFVDRIANGAFASVTPRTAGFSTFDYADATEPTLLVTSILMFVGGGSAGSAGGIKVGTFALLGLVIWAELRGDPDVSIFGRRIVERTQRQALTVALVGVALAVGGTFALSWMMDVRLSDVAFEAVSALSTVGLSRGATAELPGLGQLVVVVLMFLGRLGPVAVGTALVLRSRERLYRYPEGRPIIG